MACCSSIAAHIASYAILQRYLSGHAMGNGENPNKKSLNSSAWDYFPLSPCTSVETITDSPVCGG